MSRIDEALKMWEEESSPGTAVPASSQVTVEPSGEGFRLTEYAREGTAVVSLPESARPTSSAGTATGSMSGQGSGQAPGQAPGTALPRTPPPGRPKRANAELAARLVTGEPGAISVEQYRRVAAVLHDLQIGRGLKTLMLTSALPNEGKTLTTVNLALTLSESYARRVLIIDADLRWPSVHNVFGIANDTGLSEALLSQRTDLPIHQVSPLLSVLTAGRPGPTPLAGLASPRMGALIEECARHFDWVLLDTPPIGLLPDAQVLARLTGAVVLVIAAGSTPAAAVERAVAELGQDCIIGTVLNRVEERRIPAAGYYSHYYDAPTTSD